MLQKANDEKNNDHQEAKYTTAKFKLITPPELPLVILLLYIIQLLYFTKTLKQDFAYRHNNASKKHQSKILSIGVKTSSVNNVCALALSLMQLVGTDTGRACRRP
jgi:hypothetical protein